MRRFLLALLALALGTVAVPAASAGGNSSYVGGCDYSAGHFYVAAVVYSVQPEENQVTAQATCTLYRFGQERHRFTFLGIGRLVGQQDTPIYPLDGGTTICTRIDYLSTGDPSDSFCVSDTEGDVVRAATGSADPVLCPALGSLAPGAPPFAYVTPQGDVQVAGRLLWDCPPYGNPPIADSTSYLGTCNYSAGALALAVVVYSADPAENPVTARVTCEIRRDGVLLEYMQVTGTGVVTGTGTTSRTGDLTICTVVEYLSTGDPSDTACVPSDPLSQVTAIPDPLLCPQLAALAPGVPGVVDVTPQGDVGTVVGPLWDCPPYN